MPVQSPNRPTFTSTVLSFLINSLLGGVLFYLITIQILTKLTSVSEHEHLGYDNPFLSLLGIAFGFFVVTYLFYNIVMWLFSRVFASLWSSMLLGAVSGVLPVFCLHIFTFGINLSNAGILMEFIVMAILGAMIPNLNSFLTTKK